MAQANAQGIMSFLCWENSWNIVWLVYWKSLLKKGRSGYTFTKYLTGSYQQQLHFSCNTFVRAQFKCSQMLGYTLRAILEGHTFNLTRVITRLPTKSGRLIEQPTIATESHWKARKIASKLSHRSTNIFHNNCSCQGREQDWDLFLLDNVYSAHCVCALC